MTDNEKPLPKPLNRPFEPKKRFEQRDEQASLLADRLEAAVAEGRLEEFLAKEMPDNAYARNLAGMMMGMTGMQLPGERGQSSPAPEKEETAESRTHEVPEDIQTAAQRGDVKGLAEMLRREQQKRTPAAGPVAEADGPPAAQDAPSIGKDLIDALIAIAKDNGVSMDWLILRAMKVYVQEYQKTGRL